MLTVVDQTIWLNFRDRSNPGIDCCGLSYKVKKNVPWLILAPRAVACDSLHLRASVHLWHVSAFLCNRKFRASAKKHPRLTSNRRCFLSDILF